MAHSSNRRSLGRGLSALIPESDIDFLRGIARGEVAPAAVSQQSPIPAQPNTETPPPAVPGGPEPNLYSSPASKIVRNPEPAITTPEEKTSGQKKTNRNAHEPPQELSPLDTQTGPSSHAQTSPNGKIANIEPASLTGPVSAQDPGAIQYLPVSNLSPNPYQPRQVFDPGELADLTNSIVEHGLLQPVLVRPLPGTGEQGQELYQLIAGERRWRAAKAAGLTVVPAIVHAVGDQEALELALIENVQRHDIGAVEAAHAYRRLAQEFGLSQESIAQRVGKGRVSVANTMRLLDLPEEALTALKDGKLTEGHGRALLTASGDGARRALLRRVLRDGLSVREVERLARDEHGAHSTVKEAKTANRTRDADLEQLEKHLQRDLGARLQLKPKRRGGQIVISYTSLDDLQRLVKLINRGAAGHHGEPG